MSTYVKHAMPEKDFLERRRSIMLGYPNYKEILEDKIETFEIVTDEALASRSNAPDCTAADLSASSSARAWDAVTYLHVQYSAGISVEHLRPFFPTTLAYWEEYAKFDKAFDETPEAGGRKVPHLDLHDKDYWRAIRLCSFAILLGHTNLLGRLATLWDYENDDMDGLLERLVVPFVAGRGAPPDECTRHLPYFKLLKVFAAAADKRPALMAQYMEDWYHASRREPYYESHTKGRDHNYLGYWSFEAAAVTYVLGIDDASYRDHEFYPKDLIDFARSLPRPAALGGPSETAYRGRCDAGQPCPKEGYWFTPAKAGSRRHFKADEIMPDLGSKTWACIWQWDDNQT